MRHVAISLVSFLVVSGLPAIASAQDTAPTVIAVPVFATPKDVTTPVGGTWSLANGMADVIAMDLKSTSSFVLANVTGQRIPSYPEVTAPSYSEWNSVGARALLTGFVVARPDGRLMVGCYVYDVREARELARKGFLVVPTDWRRAAHKCADLAYTAVTGNGPLFDSRVAFIAQSGPSSAPVKRVAVMDLDGTNFTYLTTGKSTAVTPRWSPSNEELAYTSLSGGIPHLVIVDVASDKSRALLPDSTSFAPAFAPDGRHLALSIATDGNTDIYIVGLDGSGLRRLTTSPAIDTGPAFSPDGKQIAFSSDRSGSQQLYVMNSDGTAQHRISFGPGEYGAPAWSPDGKRIAFTNIAGGSTRIGIMNPDGTAEKMLTLGPADGQPSWGPSSSHVMFERLDFANGQPSLYSIGIDGRELHQVATPQGGSDPSWVAGQE